MSANVRVAGVYEAAALYDLAFSYRDYAREVAFLREVFAQHRGRQPESFLELAAGPARHALGFAREGVAAAALDIAPAMAAYGKRLAGELEIPLVYLTADMIAFETPRRYDLAACLLCSATHIASDADFVSHLRHVARALAKDGLYVIELPYPTDDAESSRAKDTWSVRDEGGELRVEWIERDERPEAGPRVFASQVRLEYRPACGPAVVVEDETLLRKMSRAQIEALVTASEVFRIEAIYGALDVSLAMDGPKAWRMVVVLSKQGGEGE